MVTTSIQLQKLIEKYGKDFNLKKALELETLGRKKGANKC